MSIMSSWDETLLLALLKNCEETSLSRHLFCFQMKPKLLDRTTKVPQPDKNIVYFSFCICLPSVTVDSKYSDSLVYLFIYFLLIKSVCMRACLRSIGGHWLVVRETGSLWRSRVCGMSLSQTPFLQGKDADSTIVRSGAILKVWEKQNGEWRQKEQNSLRETPFGFLLCVDSSKKAARFEKN